MSRTLKIEDRGWKFALLAIIYPLSSILYLPAIALAQAEAPGFTYREWLIIICDPYQSQASSVQSFNSTLPDFVDTRRSRAGASNQIPPSPLGVIRLDGKFDGKIDVKLDIKSGRFLATWPNSRSTSRPTSMLWRDIVLSNEPRMLAPLDEAHWLSPLRQGSFSFLTIPDRSERFLLYDVELGYALPLRVGGGAEQGQAVKVINAGSAPLHDVVIYRPDAASGWKTASISELGPSTRPSPTILPPPPPPPVRSAAQAQQEAQLRAQLQAYQANLISLQQQGAPAEIILRYQQQVQQVQQQLQQFQPQLPPAPPSVSTDLTGADELRLVPAGASTLPQLLGDWKERLGSFDLGPQDLDVILGILQANALDRRRLTAIYRLDDAEMDRLLPLEVVPAPSSIRRVTLVIVKNIDPSLPAEIDALIAQLGDHDWQKREEASKALAQLSFAARGKLQTAIGNKDPEIQLRAERLLGALQQAGGGGVISPTPVQPGAPIFLGL